MKPATKRLFAVLASMAFLIGALVLYSSLLVPAYGQIQELRGEKKSLDAVLEEEERLVATASQLLNQYQNATELRNNLSLVLPREEAVPGIINQVQGIAKATGVTIEGVNVEVLPLEHSKTGPVAEPYGSFRVSVRTMGNYEAIRSYVQSLETNIRIIDIDSVAISGGGTKGPIKADFVLKTYYQR